MSALPSNYRVAKRSGPLAAQNPPCPDDASSSCDHNVDNNSVNQQLIKRKTTIETEIIEIGSDSEDTNPSPVGPVIPANDFGPKSLDPASSGPPRKTKRIQVPKWTCGNPTSLVQSLEDHLGLWKQSDNIDFKRKRESLRSRGIDKKRKYTQKSFGINTPENPLFRDRSRSCKLVLNLCRAKSKSTDIICSIFDGFENKDCTHQLPDRRSLLIANKSVCRPYLTANLWNRMKTKPLPPYTLLHVPLTRTEEALLSSLVTDFHLTDWDRLSSQFVGRTANDLQRAYGELLKSQNGIDSRLMSWIYTTGGFPVMDRFKNSRLQWFRYVQHRQVKSLLPKPMGYHTLYNSKSCAHPCYLLDGANASGEIEEISFNEDNDIAFSCIGSDNYMAHNLFYINTSRVIWEQNVFKQPVTCPVAFDSNGHKDINTGEFLTIPNVKLLGKLAISGGFDGFVKVWDVERAHCVESIECHSGPLQRLAQHARRKSLFATGGEDGFVTILNIPDAVRNLENGGQSTISRKKIQYPSRTPLRPVTDVNFGMNYSDDYVFAPTFTSDRHGAAIHFINIGTSKTIASLRSEYSIDTMTVSPDGRNIIYGTFGTPNGSRHIHLCHVNDPTAVTAYYTGHDDVNYVTYSPDGRYITSSATDNTTVVIDLRFPKTILHTFSHITSSTSDGDGVRGITWLSNDELATGAEDGFVRFWDVRYNSQPPSREKFDPNDSEAHVGMLQSGAGDISTMKFNNDKTILAIGTGQKALTVYTASRRDRFRFEALPTTVRSNETPEDDPF